MASQVDLPPPTSSSTTSIDSPNKQFPKRQTRPSLPCTWRKSSDDNTTTTTKKEAAIYGLLLLLPPAVLCTRSLPGSSVRGSCCRDGALPEADGAVLRSRRVGLSIRSIPQAAHRAVVPLAKQTRGENMRWTGRRGKGAGDGEMDNGSSLEYVQRPMILKRGKGTEGVSWFEFQTRGIFSLSLETRG